MCYLLLLKINLVKKQKFICMEKNCFIRFLSTNSILKNSKPIPSYFEPYGIQKPDKGLYDKYEPMKTKIQKLKSVGIVINNDLFIELLQVYHRNMHIHQLPDKIDKSSDFFRFFKDSLTELSNEDEISEFLERNIDEQMSTMKQFASNYMDRNEKKAFKAVLGLIQNEQE